MNIVIVDDDLNIRKSLELSLSHYDEFKVKSYKNAKDALKGIDEKNCDLIITDINMPDINGIEFLRRLEGKYEAIIITGYASLGVAVDALRLGVKDFFIKTELDIDLLVMAIKRTEKEQKIKSKVRATKINNDTTLEGKNLVHIKNIALKSAKSDANILLLGESGVGKEVFAKFIHNNSNRSNNPFIAINMAALPESLLESELFGYEKGAFTDASQSKMGLFELANKGSIFLDEIGEMPLSLQAKLLRAIQEKEISRLGGTKSIKIDVRFISATNANIHEKIENNAFREDLFYRLQTIPLQIPPLRERKDEIILIANRYLKEVSQAYNRGKKELSDEAIETLLSYKWPGNIRELLSIIERATILSEGEIITKEDLFLEARDKKVSKFEQLEREYINEAYIANDKDIEQTANILGMNIDVLKYKLTKLKII